MDMRRKAEVLQLNLLEIYTLFTKLITETPFPAVPGQSAHRGDNMSPVPSSEWPRAGFEVELAQ